MAFSRGKQNKTDYWWQIPSHDAAYSGNIDTVREMVDAGVDVNKTDNEGKTALFYAVQQLYNEGVVRALIDAGVDVNKTDNEGKTALFCAAQQRDNEGVVRALIDAGADVNKTDNEGKTALFCAAQQMDNEGVVRALIDTGADVNKTDNEGKTALFYAVQQRDNEGVVRALIDAGADINKTYNKGKTALFYAVQKWDNEIVVRALIDAVADVNKTDNEGKTALFYAVQKWDNEIVVRALIDAVADVNKTDNEGKTALIYAVQRDNQGVVRALIDAVADVNKTDNEGKTALIYAVQRDNQGVVRALIDAGADVNKTDNEGKTALIYAVQRDNQGVVRALIDAGALLNTRDHYGMTPLFYALTLSSTLASYLHERGASLCLDDKYSALTFLIQRSHESSFRLLYLLNILTERKMVTNKQIFEAIIKSAFCNICSFGNDFFYLLRQAETEYISVVDVRKRGKIKKILKKIDEHKDQLLDKPEVVGEILSLLVKMGADPNDVDWNGNTALHHAVQPSSNGIPEGTVLYICNQLKKMGASLHIRNHEKETPFLHCLVSTVTIISYQGYPQWSEVQTQISVCHFLIDQGSNVEEKTQSGQSVLHLVLELLRQILLDEESRTRCLDNIVRLLQKVLNDHKEKGTPLVTKDNSGNTPLHVWAKLELATGQVYSTTICEKENTFQGLLKMILDHFMTSEEYRPQLYVKNENGETPLHLCRTWTAVELLLAAGANPNDVDSSGRAPLLAAAKNSKLIKNGGSLYPDVLCAGDEFWRKVLVKGLDPWTVDIHEESVLSVLMESECHDLARALVHVAYEDKKIRSHPLILFSLLTAICKDKSLNAQWKKDAAETILSSTKCPVNGNDGEDSPLHYCCRNVVEVKNSTDELNLTVHWRMVGLLRSYGADYRIPDTTGQSCLEIAEECPDLKDLLMEPIDLNRLPVLIKPWKSVSKTHERCLAKVARNLETNHVEAYWYYKDNLACGAFGAVFAGINEKDGREVAVKRILKISMPLPQDQREITSLTALADCEQIVRYLAFLEDKDFSYIILELMEGNLEDLLNRSMSMKEKEALYFDVVKGLSYMHGKGYLHRDLKPSNILFKNSPQLCLKIADFGLSRRMDSTGSSTSVYGSRVGTRCWIAPEVLTSTKYQHAEASDMFSCGLVLHYILSSKNHPFLPRDCANKGELQICNETERNVIDGNKEGWDGSLSPEATDLIEQLLESDATKRPTAEESVAHPLFWSKAKTIDVLIAVGNQPEFECPRAKRTPPLSPVEIDLEASFGTTFKRVHWKDSGYARMPAIYAEMTRKRTYDTSSVVELVRFIRNAHAHVSESTRPTPIRKLLLEDFVFLEYFPNLVMEVYKAVTTHGWDQTRDEIKYAMNK